jgi:hypothetical protein
MTIHTPKKRLILVCSSHSLSNFQKCPACYKYSDRLQIEPAKDYRPFQRGTVITNLLGYYYRAKKEGTLTKNTVHEAIKTILETSQLSQEDKTLISGRFLRYCSFYRNETWKIKAVEQIEPEDRNLGTGFSKIIYETDELLFVYEGEPDLIISPGSAFDYLAVVDHKSQSRKGQLFEYTNQFRGYCWATGLRHIIINYFGIQKSGEPKEWFHRKVHSFTKDHLELWKRDTIEWFFRIARAKLNKKYPRTWQCEGKYGVCHYTDLCTSAHLPFIVKAKMKKDFKKKARRRSW